MNCLASRLGRPTFSRTRVTVKAQAPAASTVAAPAATKMSVETIRARAKAAVLGAIVADAATMPLHWIYDINVINDLLAKEGRTAANPEFYPTPSCPFYNKDGQKNHEFGGNSPYGEELYPLATTLANKGAMDEAAYAQAIVDFFTASPAYRNASIRGALEAWAAGKRGREIGHATDFQANCFAKVPLLVARYAGQPDLLQHVEAAVRVQQNNDDAVKYGKAAAKILEKVVLGSTLDEALTWAAGAPEGVDAVVAGQVAAALKTKTEPLRELTFEPSPYMADMMKKVMDVKDTLPAFTLAVWCNGPACGNPAAFTNVAMTATQFGGSYVDAVRANLMAGGDNCSRSILIGALLAAQNGAASIPAEWAAKTQRYAEYEAIADKLVAHLH